MTEARGEIIIYQEQDGNPRIDVTLVDDTLWLSKRLIADLFEKDSDTIGTHIKRIYAEGELGEESTTASFSVDVPQGNRTIKRKVKFYNLDVILSVGYRVSSNWRTMRWWR